MHNVASVVPFFRLTAYKFQKGYNLLLFCNYLFLFFFEKSSIMVLETSKGRERYEKQAVYYAVYKVYNEIKQHAAKDLMLPDDK